MNTEKPKIGYFCSYVPWELLSACGWEGVFLSPSGHPSREIEALFPVSFCPFSKIIGENIRSGKLDRYLGTLSCDASCRTWEIMKAYTPQKTILSLEVPFGESVQRIQHFSEKLRRLGKILAQEKGIHLWEVEDKLGEILTISFSERQTISQLFFGGKIAPRGFLEYERESTLPLSETPKKVLLCGSHLFVEEILALLEERGISPMEESPRGARRWVVLPKGELVPSGDPFLDLARLYLEYKLPCPLSGTRRIKIIKEIVTCLGIRGIVYLYPKFCDLALYELARIRKNFSLPILPLEHDVIPNTTQWMIRIEAFLEAMQGDKLL